MSPVRAVRAVLFDRDGTLVHDVPYNGDPRLVRPVEGAREALAALRARGLRTGVVTNQSGVARGLLTDADVRRVHHRVDELLGPFDVWAVCPHGPDEGCPCRKPRPGMILRAAGRIRTDPADCVVIGDIGADVEAAHRAGARAILVPTPQTRPEETAAAPHVAPDLATAARMVLDGLPEPARLPERGGLSGSGGFPERDGFPVLDGLPEGDGFPGAGGFLERGGLSGAGGFPERGGLSGSGALPEPGGRPAPGPGGAGRAPRRVPWERPPAVPVADGERPARGRRA